MWAGHFCDHEGDAMVKAIGGVVEPGHQELLPTEEPGSSRRH